jgi:hypothetical protein
VRFNRLNTMDHGPGDKQWPTRAGAYRIRTALASARGIRRLTIVTATALFLVVGSASPASAHFSGSNIYWLGVLRGYGSTVNTHDYAYACDRREDGHRVYTEFVYSGGDGRVYDATTSAGCAGIAVGRSITRYKVCVEVSFAVDPRTQWFYH